MSDYGNPPQDPNQPNPYGQPPNPYGQPPQQADPYGQANPYGQAQAPYGQPQGYALPKEAYASWLKRVGAYLIDGLIAGLPYFVFAIIGAAVSGSSSSGGMSGGALGLTLVGALISLAIFIWNTCLRAGRTGYSIGKGALGIKLIGERTGQPIGGGMAFLRYLCHIVDALPCYIGYLWPLWDAKRQTFADKIMTTVVLNQPQG